MTSTQASVPQGLFFQIGMPGRQGRVGHQCRCRQTQGWEVGKRSIGLLCHRYKHEAAHVNSQPCSSPVLRIRHRRCRCRTGDADLLPLVVRTRTWHPLLITSPTSPLQHPHTSLPYPRTSPADSHHASTLHPPPPRLPLSVPHNTMNRTCIQPGLRPGWGTTTTECLP